MTRINRSVCLAAVLALLFSPAVTENIFSQEPLVESPVSSGANKIVERRISAKVAEAFPPDLQSLAGEGAFILDLGECRDLIDAPHKFVITDLPPGGRIVVSLAWFDKNGLSRRRVLSPKRDLGIEAWRLEWQAQGKDAKYTTDPSNTEAGTLIGDPPRSWLTLSDEVYELTLTTLKVRQKVTRSRSSAVDSVHLVLVAAFLGEGRIVEDSRPKGQRVVDHGRFSRRDMDVMPFGFKTPSGMYHLDLGKAEAEEGLVHRYEIEQLPAGYILDLGFGVSSDHPLIRGATGGIDRNRDLFKIPLWLPAAEFWDQSGIERLHIHLQTKDGLVLISNEFVKGRSFPYTLPLYGSMSRINGFVAEGSRDGWRFMENTASGSCFVIEKGEKYVLEIMIVKMQKKGPRQPVFRPMIRS